VDINEIRVGINDIDEKMMDLFHQRMAYVKALGEIKKQGGAPILVPEREKEILDKHSTDAFSKRFLIELMAISRCIQTKACLTENIVLIGMPGSGKTTIGRILAEFIDVEWVDIDIKVEEEQGKPITKIFKELGEEEFRKMETKVLRETLEGEHKIVSTGGGVIKNIENVHAIRESSLVIFIDRPVEAIALDIDTTTRPLLAQPGALQKLYDERIDLYRKYADHTISGNLCPINIANQILQHLQS
jgi:shikimate kinase